MAAPTPEDLLLQFILILIAGKLAGEAVERLHQPAVLGELLAGILLGPTLLTSLLTSPSGETPGFLMFENEVITFLAEVGIILLLLEVGLESDVGEIKRVGLVAAAVAAVGVAVPFLLGWALFTYGSVLGLGQHPDLAGLFLGATMTATSIGISARVLADLRRLNTEEGKIVIGAAIIDDVIGLILLSIMIGLATVGQVDPLAIALIVVLALIFLVGSIVGGQGFAPFLLRLVERMKVRGVLIATVVVVALALAAVAQSIGLATILGAFAAGAIFARTEDRFHIEERLKPLADVFVPVFFVLMGTRVDLRTLGADGVGLLAAVILVVAVASKLVAGLAVPPGRARRLPVGVGMIPRGEVGIIFAGIGLTTPPGNPVFSPAIYSAIIIMVFGTTLVTPPLLKVVFRRVPVEQKPSTLVPIPRNGANGEGEGHLGGQGPSPK